MKRVGVVLCTVFLAGVCRIAHAGESWLLLSHQSGEDTIAIPGIGVFRLSRVGELQQVLDSDLFQIFRPGHLPCRMGGRSTQERQRPQPLRLIRQRPHLPRRGHGVDRQGDSRGSDGHAPGERRRSIARRQNTLDRLTVTLGAPIAGQGMGIGIGEEMSQRPIGRQSR